MGLNFKLDVGTLRLDLQVACQRYRQNLLDAKSTKTRGMIAELNSRLAFFNNALATPALV
jgi:hypothetical protein